MVTPAGRPCFDKDHGWDASATTRLRAGRPCYNLWRAALFAARTR
jgi:hypothetical protein